MRVVQWQRIGDRRVHLFITTDNAYMVTIEVLGPDLVWHDISMRADARLRADEAEHRYRQRVAEQGLSKTPPSTHRAP